MAAAFRFAFENIKPKDAVVVGMFPKYEDQIALNVQHTIEACRAAGCDVLVAASAIFRSDDYAGAIETLRGPATCLGSR